MHRSKVNIEKISLQSSNSSAIPATLAKHLPNVAKILLEISFDYFADLGGYCKMHINFLKFNWEIVANPAEYE